jgi:hypothetical protein
VPSGWCACILRAHLQGTFYSYFFPLVFVRRYSMLVEFALNFYKHLIRPNPRSFFFFQERNRFGKVFADAVNFGADGCQVEPCLQVYTISIYLSIYLCIYLPTYLPTYLSIYSRHTSAYVRIFQHTSVNFWADGCQVDAWLSFYRPL